MTPFEQFVAREYGRKQGDPIDDIYDEAKARWKQSKILPVNNENVTAAQNIFASIPESRPDAFNNLNAPMPQEQAPDPFGEEDVRADLLKPPPGGDLASIAESLPDTSGVRREALVDAEIAARQANPQERQAQQLPDDLKHSVWRMFADDYTNFYTTTRGAMKADERRAILNDYDAGWQQNYAPVLGVPRAEAEALVRKALLEENRPLQISDWKRDTPTTRELSIDEKGKVLSNVKALRDQGLNNEADAELRKYNIVEERNVGDEAVASIQKINRYQAALADTKSLTEGTERLDEAALTSRIADEQARLVGMKTDLRGAPSIPGKLVRVEDIILENSKNGRSKPAEINTAIARMAKENPGLLVNYNGDVSLASKFQIDDPTAPKPENQQQNQNEYGFDGRGAARLVKDAVAGSWQGIKNANDYAANVLYKVGSTPTIVPGVIGAGGLENSGQWFRDFVDEIKPEETSEAPQQIQGGLDFGLGEVISKLLTREESSDPEIRDEFAKNFNWRYDGKPPKITKLGSYPSDKKYLDETWPVAEGEPEGKYNLRQINGTWYAEEREPTSQRKEIVERLAKRAEDPDQASNLNSLERAILEKEGYYQPSEEPESRRQGAGAANMLGDAVNAIYGWKYDGREPGPWWQGSRIYQKRQ